MPDYTSTHNLLNRYDTSENIYFTDHEANYCRIESTTKIYYNSVFNHWEFKVLDRLGNTYTWKDFRCLEGADKANVKLAIFNHLTTSVIRVKEDENNAGHLRTSSSVADRGQDEHVGD
tara:strand:- start:276 stop:629 length:354 start_codon:yes stop_codon:yes gene_type:complete